MRERAATHGKRFAVIADEAHSSQAGETAAKLKAVLTPEEIEEISDGGEISTEDLLAAQMAARASADGVTYVAFTATPKTKTMELFGRRPSPDLPASEMNKPAPFHVYSMLQYEIDRLVTVELDPSATQGQLIAALEPLAQRLLHLSRMPRNDTGGRGAR